MEQILKVYYKPGPVSRTWDPWWTRDIWSIPLSSGENESNKYKMWNCVFDQCEKCELYSAMKAYLKEGLYTIQIKEQWHLLPTAHQIYSQFLSPKKAKGWPTAQCSPACFTIRGGNVICTPVSTSQHCHFRAWPIKCTVTPISGKSMTQSNDKSYVEDGRATVSQSPWMTTWRDSTPTTWPPPLLPTLDCYVRRKETSLFGAITFGSIVFAV